MKNSSTDGRAKRSARSRQQIIDAMVKLINENGTFPTAQQVADEAGVAIRTVFRHFSEMEKLYAELDSAMQPMYNELFAGGDRDGALAERLQHAVECHAAAFSALKYQIRGTMEVYWRSPVLKKNYARHQRNLRKDLEDWL
ncbi:MAG: TetR/AcrR family transcriptional regulator, partial [Gammaproteobacteria bacterium]|nr:TetR/AcrR family transcriptional regulator [Gammaproteobacteria bacterium]